MRSSAASLLTLSALALACGGEPVEPVPSEPVPAPDEGPQSGDQGAVPLGMWPAQPDAAWPKGCLIENAALHPSQPWLAVACSDVEEENGAILLFDLDAGTLRSAVRMQGWVGWNEAELLRWHPDGRQLASNVQTNGIVVFKDAQPIGHIFPDETRDTGVGHVWTGEKLYTDTGHLVQVKQDDWRFDFEYKEGAPGFHHMRWNAVNQTVVGWEQSSFVSYDPVTETRRVELPILPRSVHLGCSADGHWCAGRQIRPHPAPDALVLVNATEGVLMPSLLLSRAHFRDLAWAPSGGFVTSSYVHTIGAPRSGFVLDIWQEGVLQRSMALGDREPSYGGAVEELGALSWSGDSESLAVLLKSQEVLLFDAVKGQQTGEFLAPSAPVPPRLPSWYARDERDGSYEGTVSWGAPERIVRVGGHFVSIWTPQGEKLAEFIVPTGG